MADFPAHLAMRQDVGLKSARNFNAFAEDCPDEGGFPVEDERTTASSLRPETLIIWQNLRRNVNNEGEVGYVPKL
jgi:hypothetical protein